MRRAHRSSPLPIPAATALKQDRVTPTHPRCSRNPPATTTTGPRDSVATKPACSLLTHPAPLHPHFTRTHTQQSPSPLPPPSPITLTGPCDPVLRGLHVHGLRPQAARGAGPRRLLPHPHCSPASPVAGVRSGAPNARPTPGFPSRQAISDPVFFACCYFRSPATLGRFIPTSRCARGPKAWLRQLTHATAGKQRAGRPSADSQATTNGRLSGYILFKTGTMPPPDAHMSGACKNACRKPWSARKAGRSPRKTPRAFSCPESSAAFPPLPFGAQARWLNGDPAVMDAMASFARFTDGERRFSLTPTQS